MNEDMQTKKLKLKKKISRDVLQNVFFLHSIFEYILVSQKTNFKSLAQKIKKISTKFKKDDFTQVRTLFFCSKFYK